LVRKKPRCQSGGPDIQERANAGETETAEHRNSEASVMRKLFAANPARIGRPSGPVMCDAVPAERSSGTPVELREALEGLLGPSRVLHRVTDLVRYASDASPYRRMPNVVVMPRTVDEVSRLLAFCSREGRHATFRAAGTSLNGQSQ